MKAPHTAEAGFSVIEALVALAIIAAMTGSFFSVIALDASATQKAAEKRLAGQLAGSLLAQSQFTGTASALSDTGTQNGLTWRSETTAYGGNARAGGPPVEMVRITIVGRSSKPVFELQTLRFAR